MKFMKLALNTLKHNNLDEREAAYVEGLQPWALGLRPWHAKRSASAGASLCATELSVASFSPFDSETFILYFPCMG